MPRVQSAGSASTSASTTAASALKRNQACHQCRKRKLKCNAQKPCATCTKSHRLAVAANPTLAGTEPECTFDEFSAENPPPPPEGPRAKYQRLENRINELESLLKEQASKEASTGPASLPTPSSNHASPSNSFPLPESNIERLNSDISGFLITPPLADNNQITSLQKSNPFLPTSPPEAYITAASPSNAGPLMIGEWPRRLPPPDLLHHLIDVFFNCYPHAHYLLHRPTFMASLTFPPKSPAFPHSSLLHSICAYASVFSPRVETPPPSSKGALFPEQPGDLSIENSFAEKHVRWSRQARDEATSMGSNLIECTQSLIVMVGYYHLQGRWVELWASAGLALRYCVPLGLNNRAGFHTARTHPKTWLRNGGKSILPEPENAIERETRINLFWIAYAYERFQTAPGPWAMSLDDEDISQVFPGKLDDFEAGNDVEENRQTMQTLQFLSVHPPETTDTAVLLSKVKILSLRVGHRYPNIKDVRDTPAFRHLESTIALFRSTFPPGFHEPITQTVRGFDTQLYVAHLIPHVAIILMHEEHAQLDSPNCLSTQKSMLAARAILDLVYVVCSTSYDITRLPPVVSFCWLMAARVLIRVLKHKYQAGLRSEAATMRSEVEVIRLAFLRMSERIPLALKHGKMIDELLETELANMDDSVYGTCTYSQIYDPAFVREGASYDWPGGAAVVEVTSQDTSATASTHIPTPDLGIIQDVVGDMGPILTDIPTSASAALEQLLQSMDSDSFLLAGGYGDISQMPLF
ncbi:Fungal specific transcription factor domain [Ceratobasidium sp. AG-Ba]|nr:Fungal specific transcription factor domain [Ceratobasidium sp. AG-Ba]